MLAFHFIFMLHTCYEHVYSIKYKLVNSHKLNVHNKYIPKLFMGKIKFHAHVQKILEQEIN